MKQVSVSTAANSQRLPSSFLGFPGGWVGKESACNAGDAGSTPGSGRSPGGGHGNPLWYSCLKNPLDKGAWRATVHRVTELDMSEATEHACMQGLSCSKSNSLGTQCRAQPLLNHLVPHPSPDAAAATTSIQSVGAGWKRTKYDNALLYCTAKDTCWCLEGNCMYFPI